jgi:hypothetical protein
MELLPPGLWNGKLRRGWTAALRSRAQRGGAGAAVTARADRRGWRTRPHDVVLLICQTRAAHRLGRRRSGVVLRAGPLPCVVGRAPAAGGTRSEQRATMLKR